MKKTSRLSPVFPETGGGSAFVAAGATLYEGTSIAGQAIAGMGQAYAAISGDSKGGEAMSQTGEILSGPVSGVFTLS